MPRRARTLAVVVLAAAAVVAPHGDAVAAPPSLHRLRVPSETMVPTIPIGAWVDVDGHAYDHALPQLGDIVILHPPRSEDDMTADLPPCGVRRRKSEMCARATPGLSAMKYIKRVVGLPGDRLSMRGGHLIRNGARAAEPFIATDRCPDIDECDFPRAITVAPGRYFLLGDNRGASFDSRYWGPMPLHALLSKVVKCTPPAGGQCGTIG
jgi:signal peptidase I